MYVLEIELGSEFEIFHFNTYDEANLQLNWYNRLYQELIGFITPTNLRYTFSITNNGCVELSGRGNDGSINIF